MALAFVASSTLEDQHLIDKIVRETDPRGFADQLLRAKDLSWAADALVAFPGNDAPFAMPQPENQVPERPSERRMAELLSPYHAAARPRRTVRKAITALAFACLALIATPLPTAALTVFDPLNYEQNLLSAARALEQINNQIRQLEAQAQMLLRMDRNLQSLTSTLSPDLQRTLSELQQRLQDGQGLALKLRETEENFARLFPQQTNEALSNDDVLRNAKSRWEEEYQSLRRSALLQGRLSDALGLDSQLLDEALARSRNATGALDVAQAGNELTGLHITQSLQLQGLFAAQSRTETLKRAQELSIEEEFASTIEEFHRNR